MDNSTINSTVSHHDASLISIYHSILLSPTASIFVLASTLFVLSASTRFLSGKQSTSQIDGVKVVPSVPYWTPFLGHVFKFLYNPVALMNQARDATGHGIFSLRLGPTIHNIVSDPDLVRNVMQQKETVVRFKPIAWTVMIRFFDTPARLKAAYFEIWERLHMCVTDALMREPHLSNTLKVVTDHIEENVPHMITFMDGLIDQQPWERSSNCHPVSTDPLTAEINLFSLMRDMLGYASVPSLLGKTYMEKYPNILQDIYTMDSGFKWLMTGLPRWIPIPPLTSAHIARKRVKDSMTAFFEAYDDVLNGKPISASWGDMEDVSELMRLRTIAYREYGFTPRDRADISILWALTANANVCVYWQLLHILANQSLVDRIREEIEPYARVEQPLSINGISEAPRLKISHDGLSKHCPLFKASFYEANRLCNQPWSIRQTEADIVLGSRSSTSKKFSIKKGEFITVPHELHMLDPHYFDEPLKFHPDRFLQTDDKGNVTVSIGTIRPFGGGPSQCKGRVYAERECLALVAGVLVMWDFEPADSAAGWVIPGQRKATSISLPAHDTRVRIKRRVFDWDK